MRTAAFLLLCVPALLGQAPAAAPAERLADAALAFAQQEAGKLGGEHRFKVVQPPRVPTVRPGVLSFEASHLSKREPLGRFFVVVALLVNGERVGMVRVDLEGSWAGNLLRAKGDLARKTEVTADLLEASPFDGIPPEGALAEVPEGKRILRPVAAGKILTRADLEPIPLVQSGDKVRLTSTQDTLTISLDTTARSRAGLGDKVRLEAPGARRTVTAVVTAPGEARLQ